MKTDQTNAKVLATLVRWAESQLPSLIDQSHEAVLARIALYRAGQPVSHADLRRSIGQNLSFVLAAIREPRAPRDHAAPQETGHRRAQQAVPLPEVLQAYRISFATLWEALVEHARTEQPAAADALLDAASMIWQLTDEHALVLTEAYRATTAEMLLASQRRRSALVEALLTGHPGPEAGPWDAASFLGFAPDGELVVVATETRELAEESLTGIESRLATHGIVSGWRLTPALQVGVVSARPGQYEIVLQLLSDIATTRTGVSPRYRHLSETPRSLQLARAALGSLPEGAPGVHVFDASPLAALMACEPGEGLRLALQVLGSVLSLPSEDREVLLDTLRAYLDHHGSAERAGEALHCHANTVRYRLRRVQELTGRAVADPYGLAELAAASYAIRPARPGRSGESPSSR
jgi:DNA-binding PucR family transcriptional regulator